MRTASRLAAAAVLTVVVPLLAARPAVPEDGRPGAAGGGVERTPEFLARVDAAIDRGVAWLRSTQAPDGSFAEYPTFPGAATALAYHTLRVCGVPKDDPAARRAWDAARRLAAKGPFQTYSAAVHLLAVASRGERAAGARGDRADRDVRLSAEDRPIADEAARWLVSRQDAQGRWSYGGGYGPEPPGTYDHSNTQYALLGLKEAARCGVAVDPAVWRRSLDHLLAAQEKEGREISRRPPAGAASRKGGTWAWIVDHARGWDYHGTDFPGRRGAYPAMTAGGVASVVLCRSELAGTKGWTPALDAASDRAMRDGLAWLGTRWRPDPYAAMPAATADRMRRAPGAADLYEFYAVERAGVLAGVDWMADLDWYGEGARFLVGAQADDGSWSGKATGLQGADRALAEAALRPVDTCFALLFLKRGTAPVRRGGVTPTTGDGVISFEAGARLSGRAFEEFLDLVLAKWSRLEGETPRASLLDAATALGAKIVEPLLARIESPDLAVRTAAHALLRRATGADVALDPAGDAAARAAAAAAWRAWWLPRKDRLRYDESAGRLVAE